MIPLQKQERNRGGTELHPTFFARYFFSYQALWKTMCFFTITNSLCEFRSNMFQRITLDMLKTMGWAIVPLQYHSYLWEREKSYWTFITILNLNLYLSFFVFNQQQRFTFNFPLKFGTCTLLAMFVIRHNKTEYFWLCLSMINVKYCIFKT